MCAFSVPFNSSANDLVDKLRSAVTSNNGTFQGDEIAGSLKVPTPVGSVSGSYNFSGQSININISEKPFFVSCAQIEKYITQYLNGK